MAAALLAALCTIGCEGPKPTFELQLPEEPDARVLFAAEQLGDALAAHGYAVVEEGGDRVVALTLSTAEGLKKEGFAITSDERLTTVAGNDATGLLYGCRELIDRMEAAGRFEAPARFEDAPEMVLRGTCIGVQKPYYLPGRTSEAKGWPFQR